MKMCLGFLFNKYYRKYLGQWVGEEATPRQTTVHLIQTYIINLLAVHFLRTTYCIAFAQ
jgi:hypothetical protein